MINDYDIARADMGQCLLDLVDGYDIDYLGVQSHMKAGFSGDALKYRLDLLASADHPLWITEFDTSHLDLAERAKDTEDFLRQAYSHQDVIGIITWYYMIENTSFAQFFFDHQTIFEGEVNANSQDYLTANNGSHYPLYPNAAGMAWIQLIKKDWTSDETISIGSDNLADVKFNRNIFNGDFTISVKDADGNVVDTKSVTVDNQACKNSIKADNIVTDGEFDSSSLDAQWTASGSTFHWDGYMREGLYFEDFSSATLSLSNASNGVSYNVSKFSLGSFITNFEGPSIRKSIQYNAYNCSSGR